MKKTFNITGKCIPARHYMMDMSGKLQAVFQMVEQGDYFTINRPRQYGKTTMLFHLYDYLNRNAGFMAFNLSFEGIGDEIFLQESVFAPHFLKLLADEARFLKDQATEQFVRNLIPGTQSMAKLRDAISAIAAHLPQHLVLLIDEVDKSSNNQLFLSFLGMLRDKFLNRDREGTFHAVVLAGVHDVRSLKLKLRPEETAKYNSPWNIAADFKVEMSFRPHEIAPMLEDYAQAEGVAIDIPAFAEKLYYYTSGYPFLVSKLCKNLAEDILPQKSEREWTFTDLEAAINLLLRENNTNFDSLIKNLENNPDLYNLTYQIIVNGLVVPFNPDEPIAALGRLYGVFRQNGNLVVHNRIYAQRIYNYMIAKVFNEQFSNSPIPSIYTLPDGSLDLKKVLIKFQEFIREQYSKKDESFLERQWRLLFLAFLKPIINGNGYDFKEVQISEERRLDVVITYLQHRYVVELKRWYGPQWHERGLVQLADYLDHLHLDEGYLICFENLKGLSGQQEELEYRGKKLFVVWV
ncbi:MAG TPA: AAA-like domain-containing protein [Saprospiraceae bacterium]|nr:AAA-like domain-containing protein [Saprospiraceae bacterium]HMQ81841.1 AAA-like domain-containing protein [Saprospiraceae bacterium]